MKHIEIAGWTYHFGFADEVTVDGVAAAGEIDSVKRRITLLRHQSIDSAIETILHEIGHAWRNHHPVPRDDEAQAADLANVMWMIHRWMTANDVVRWLEGELGKKHEPAAAEWHAADGADRRRGVVRHVVCAGLSDEHAATFLARAEALGLDPLKGDCYPRVQFNPNTRQPEVLCLTTVDGLARRAEATGQLRGFTPAEWCGEDGKWVDVWVKEEPPSAARVGVRRAGWEQPVYAVANWQAYAGWERGADNTMQLSHFWRRMGPHMLAKCARALALRVAFATECAQLLTAEELQQQQPTPASRRRDQAETEKPPRTPEELKALLVKRGMDAGAVTRAIRFIENQNPDFADESPELWANAVADQARKFMRKMALAGV